MTGKETCQPTCFLSVAQPDEGLLQTNRALGIVTRARHVQHAVLVRFEFVASSVTLIEHLCSDACAADGEIPVVAVARRNGGRQDHTLQQHAALHALGRMPCRRMHDLVGENRGKFGFGVQLGQNTAVYCDLAARQCPGIRHRVVEYDEFIGEPTITDGRKTIADAGNILCQHRVDVVLAALRLLHGQVILHAHLYLAGFADQR